VPTAADPLRVLVVGDSLGLSFGQSLATRLDATGVVRTAVDAREGTGLARPDAFDWPAQLRADITRARPEVIVVCLGGNDDQDVQVDGRYLAFGSPGWQETYRSRVTRVVDEARAAGAHLLWSGLPVMRSSAKTFRLDILMTITQQALAGREGTLWVDNLATLADRSGRYQVALPDASGQLVLVREPDGIHDTRAGADRLADHAVATMTGGWHLSLGVTGRPAPGPPAPAATSSPGAAAAPGSTAPPRVAGH